MSQLLVSKLDEVYHHIPDNTRGATHDTLAQHKFDYFVQHVNQPTTNVRQYYSFKLQKCDEKNELGGSMVFNIVCCLRVLCKVEEYPRSGARVDTVVDCFADFVVYKGL